MSIDSVPLDHVQNVFEIPFVYEISLIAVGIVGITTVFAAVRHATPWWEARAMKAEEEKAETTKVGFHIWWTLKNMVKDGELSVDRAEVWARRFATPCPPVLPNGVKNLKAELQEKHPTTAEVKANPEVLSLCARLSARKREATA